MAIGNFKEANDSKNEINETNEAIDNTEKPRNQILETPEEYADEFDNKLDSNETERNREGMGEREGEKPIEGIEEKQSILDKMRNLFSCKDENNEKSAESDDKSETKENIPEARRSFMEDLRRDAPSMDEQAETAKTWQEGNNAIGTEESSAEGDVKSTEHGEDGERTRASDARWAREHEFD